MPQPQDDELNKINERHFAELRKPFQPEVSKASVADVNASKELGRLATYILANYPGELYEGSVVDVVIRLLEKAKA